MHNFDYYKSYKEIVEDNGFAYDEYEVTTEDGYILKMFRIRTYEVKFAVENAPVVFLQHGLFTSSDQWVAHEKYQAPAFKFALNGYDVWLGNNRGNSHSKRHVKLSPVLDAKAFFNYSFVDLGKYDLPAQVDMVRKHIGKRKLTYIGHSQGATQMFYALSQVNYQWYSERINLFVALAPVTSNSHATTGPVVALAKKKKEFDAYIEK